ncbi:MAG: DUF4199 domain-containing protein [Flavobacteriales bacterium]|jgi:hypothetical protein|nr:DUF4199 domain-containing protein [Flavobacteriales bacterium]
MKRDKLAIEYGTYAGILMVLIVSGIGFFGFQVSPWVTTLLYLLPIPFMIIGGNTSSSKSERYFYRDAFSFTFKVGIFASIILSLYTYIDMEFLDVEKLDKIMKLQEDVAREVGAKMGEAKEVTEKNIQTNRENMSVFRFTMLTLITYIIVNGILALISAAFVKKKVS